MSHTKEPWVVEHYVAADGYEQVTIRPIMIMHDGKLGPCPAEQLANARRIVECVNACAGLANPAALPELLEAVQSAIEDLENDALEWDDLRIMRDSLQLALAKLKGGA